MKLQSLPLRTPRRYCGCNGKPWNRPKPPKFVFPLCKWALYWKQGLVATCVCFNPWSAMLLDIVGWRWRRRWGWIVLSWLASISFALSHICFIVCSCSREGVIGSKFYFLFWTFQGSVQTWKMQPSICIWQGWPPLRRLKFGREQWDSSIC